MANPNEKSQSGLKSAEKRSKSPFMDKILFLNKIRRAIDSYNAYCDTQRRFFSDIHVIIEVNKHDISKENEKTIDEQSNTGSRHYGTNKTRRTY